MSQFRESHFLSQKQDMWLVCAVTDKLEPGITINCFLMNNDYLQKSSGAKFQHRWF